MLNNETNLNLNPIKYKNTYVFWIACTISSIIITGIVAVLSWFVIRLFDNLTYQIITIFLGAILWSNLLSKFIIAAHRVYADRYEHLHERDSQK